MKKRTLIKNLATPAGKKKLSRIKLLLLDVDGVMTDGKVFWINGSGWTRTFCVKDGYGIRTLMKAGVEVGMITGGNAQDARERAKLLGIERAYYGSEDKLTIYDQILKETGLKDEDVAFMGDELFDIPVLKRVGFAATVSDAPKEVKKEVDYITKTLGGSGAVREVIDQILALKLV